MRHDVYLILSAVCLLIAASFHWRRVTQDHTNKPALITGLFVIVSSGFYMLLLPIADVAAVSLQMIATFIAVPEPWHTKRRARRCAGALALYAVAAILSLPYFTFRG